MRIRKGLDRRFIPRGYIPVEVKGLDGQFCEACGDGFWSLKSERKITQALTEHMAKEDARRIVASELASVAEAAKLLGVTRQAIHKMMNEGRLRYVQTPSLRLPIREFLEQAERKPWKAHRKPAARPSKRASSRSARVQAK
ncbi:MAG: hypothetical protein HYV26_16600 [Candidatus Hydrogenedentes bacterium]|nr:hypothetical protein [Candidatus Hydrogenedentota bacterium]MBI3117789.1 hypothetical protein [Candidatus Hydrogenedentota bacterium]